MPRQFYYFAIVIFATLILQGALLTMAFESVGRRIYAFDSFMPYFILVSVTEICCSLIIVLYCYSRRYIWTSRVAWLCVLLMVFHTAVVYEIIIEQNLESWYYYSYGGVFVANLLLGVSLVLSESRERFWLKWIGITSIFLNTAQIALLIWHTVFADFRTKAMLSEANFVLSWFTMAITGLWVIHFISELKAKKGLNSLSGLSLVTFVLFTATIGSFSIYFGSDFYEESKAPLPERNSSATERTLADRFESHLFISIDGDKLPYRLMKPLDYDSSRKYPIVLCLHHGGAHGRDNVAQVQGSYAPVLAHYDNRRNHPAFLLIPQCEVGSVWMDSNVDSAIMELIAFLEKKYSIDTLRRYVIGESGGGYGSWHFIGTHPGIFAAAIPICGGGEEKLAENMMDVSIWAFHGSMDKLVPVNYSRKMVHALRKVGSKPRYTEFPGADHYIGKRVADTPGIWDWLFMQKRKR